jgi:hypothetical protein
MLKLLDFEKERAKRRQPSPEIDALLNAAADLLNSDRAQINQLIAEVAIRDARIAWLEHQLWQAEMARFFRRAAGVGLLLGIAIAVLLL